MTSLTAYHFPETNISPQDVGCQLLFFSQIFSLAPLEDDQGGQDERCPTYAPAPLGDDLQRFRQLLAELKGNGGAFYQGHLSRLALEHLEQRAPETVRDIISGLQRPGSPPAADPSIAKTREELWQARLLLKLAEMQNKEEKELAEGLTRLEERQGELLQELKGEEFADLLQTSNNTPRPPAALHQEPLVKAWGRLLLAGERRPWFLNCFCPEAAEPFFATNEKLSGQRPVRLLRLALPHCSHDPENYEEKRQLWLAGQNDCRQKISASLHDIAAQGLGPNSLADLTRLAALWTTSATQEIWTPPPATGCRQKSGAPHLEIYLLNHPIAELVASLCARQYTPDHSEPWRHGLLAVLSSRSATCK